MCIRDSLNTASAPLLSYISGISSAVAKNIVAYREENGRFTDRRGLLKVAKLGPKAFEQCAGFMRIQGGTNPLDATGVHPESYEAAEKLLKKQGFQLEDITGGKLTGLSLTIKDYKKLAEELGIGEITLRDIVKELEKPARDPREEMPKPILRTDVLEMKDLKEGMVLKGTVRNVIDFGVFVDIGAVSYTHLDVYKRQGSHRGNHVGEWTRYEKSGRTDECPAVCGNGVPESGQSDYRYDCGRRCRIWPGESGGTYG